MRGEIQPEFRSIRTRTISTGQTGHQEFIAADWIGDVGQPLRFHFAPRL
jgi:hypothetical protein